MLTRLIDVIERLRVVKSVVGLGICVVPLFASADPKPHDDFTTVTEALDNISKGREMDLRKELMSMDKSWGSKAFVQYFKNTPEVVDNKPFRIFLIHGLIIYEQFEDPEVMKILLAHKDEDYIGLQIIHKLKLDNTENEKRALAVLDGYTDESDGELVQKSMLTLQYKPNLLKPYKNVLIKIVGRADKDSYLSRLAAVSLEISGEIPTLFDLYEKSGSHESKKVILLALMTSLKIKNQADSDPSLRNAYFEKYRKIVNNEKDEELRFMAFRELTSVVDCGPRSGMNPDVRKYLEKIEASTTESQDMKYFAGSSRRRL